MAGKGTARQQAEAARKKAQQKKQNEPTQTETEEQKKKRLEMEKASAEALKNNTTANGQPIRGRASGGGHNVQQPGPGKAEGGEVNDIDADSIIDAFLEENPDFVDMPVEEWPDDALQLLQEVMNSKNVDEPNGELPAEEQEMEEPPEPIAEDEPVVESAEIETPPATEDMPQDAMDEPSPTQDEDDFDFLALSKLVQEGDKDGAWDMLQTMFGLTPSSETIETNPLDRRMEPEKEEKGANALAKMIAQFR